MSRNGRSDGPTLNESTADLNVRVRVVGSSFNRGLCGWIVAGENGPKPTIEFDSGETRAYDVHRLQLYSPNGAAEYKMGVKPVRPNIPQVGNGLPSRKPAQRPHVVVTNPDDPVERRRQPKETVEKEPKEPIERQDADWNF